MVKKKLRVSSRRGMLRFKSIERHQIAWATDAWINYFMFGEMELKHGIWEENINFENEISVESLEKVDDQEKEDEKEDEM